MNFKNSMVPLVVGVSLAGGVALGVLYLLFKKDDDEFLGRNRRAVGGVTSTRATTINMSIAKDVVGIVIGRGGANIRDIQEQTKTKINFKEESETESHRMCSITGSAENAQFAESMIHNIIVNQPLITTIDITVPVRACGRIIGRNGENIRAITQQSGAKVTVDNSGGKDNKFGDRRITLKGTLDQIGVAQSLIEEKVEEDANLRQKCVAGASSRTPRGNKSPQYIMPAEQSQTGQNTSNYHNSRLQPSGNDRTMEVYVSAVESPDRFWVQMVSPSSVELDQLLEQMTEYYSKEENQELHVIEELELGQYVAAPFLSDGKWYRALVVSVEEDDYEPEKTLVELYYVDYGDTYDVPRRLVLELSADFLTLPFQAIECALAKVKPSGEDDWSEESTDLFEVLTYNAKWKVIMCSVDHYDPDKVRRQDRGRREGSPVPVVNLFDISGAKDINVAEELVKNKFAVYTNPKKSDSPVKKGAGFVNESKPLGFAGSNVRNRSTHTSTVGPSGASTSTVRPSTTTTKFATDRPSPVVASHAKHLDNNASKSSSTSTSETDTSPIIVSSRVAANFGQRRVDNGGGDASTNGHSSRNSSLSEEKSDKRSQETKGAGEKKAADTNELYRKLNPSYAEDGFDLY